MGIVESMGRGLNLAAESIGEGFEFAKAKWASIFAYLLIGRLAATIVIFAGIIVGGGAAYLTYKQIGLWAAGALGIGLFILALIGGLTLGYAPLFGAVEFVHGGKKRGYFERSNVDIGLKWAIAVFIAIVLVFGGAILAMATIPPAEAILFLLFYFGTIFAMIILAIIAYYAVYEAAMEKMGPVKAIMSSYRLVKANFWETLVFALVAWVMSYIAGLGATMVFYILYFAAVLLALVLPAAAIAIAVVVFLALVALHVLIECFIFPMQVLFYRKIIERKGMPAAKASGGKEAPAKKKLAS
ncbi:MAG: hypothetical protein QXH30_01710 [Candidatus Bilamarchaeaceae archaeon]